MDTSACAPLVIALDADDTLWHSETHFELTTQRFMELVAPWVPDTEQVEERLLARERANLAVFGYGVKGFTLSLIETAIEISEGRVPAAELHRIVEWGKALMTHPVELLDGVAEVVETLCRTHRLMVITKGDLLHQESKVAESGLGPLFDALEIVTEKDTATYRRILARHQIDTERFVMVGNSVSSDVLPVLELGGTAVHVPYELTWALERAEVGDDHDDRLWRLDSIRELPALIDRLEQRRA